MSKYYNNYNNRDYKNKQHKKRNGKWSSIISTVLVVFAILAVFGGLAALMRRDTQTTTPQVEYKTVYFIPSDDWKADGSLYGAWCWSESGLPGSKFVLATDENEDGVFELKIHKDYTGINFIDLKPDTDSLGLNWANKREQTDNIDLPVDDKVFYHQYCNEWSATSDLLFAPTTEEVTVYFDSTELEIAFDSYLYVFDKTGKTEASFIRLIQINDAVYSGIIPVGYTHLIFLDCDGSWDTVAWQSADLLIPTDDNILYVYSTESWTTYNSAE